MVVLVIFVNIVLNPPPDHRAEAVEYSSFRLDSYPAVLGPTLRSFLSCSLSPRPRQGLS